MCTADPSSNRAPDYSLRIAQRLHSLEHHVAATVLRGGDKCDVDTNPSADHRCSFQVTVIRDTNSGFGPRRCGVCVCVGGGEVPPPPPAK